jgi:hypothetical protein
MASFPEYHVNLEILLITGRPGLEFCRLFVIYTFGEKQRKLEWGTF